MTTFPAVLIGGPPHSGKSVFVYSLTHHLRQRGVPHYVLRATPDGEGDWSNEADQKFVRRLRRKGEFTETFTQMLAGFLQKRHLPLLVDVGGRPTLEQEAVFAYCTHAILLVGHQGDDDAYARDLAEWEARMERLGIPVIARLTSRLAGENRLASASPIICGELAGLERGQLAEGPVVTAVLDKLAQLFAYTQEELTTIHLSQAPVELTLDLPRLARTLGSTDENWQPEQLPELLNYLPQGKPLAAYGRAPNWIYGALAGLSMPAPFWLWDARLGWVEPPVLPFTATEIQDGWETQVTETGNYVHLAIATHGQYLDITEPEEMPLPDLPGSSQRGLVVSGKIPHWIVTAVIRQFMTRFPWTAVYHPVLQKGVVVTGLKNAPQLLIPMPI
ncbi:MAG: hypothetical protein D6706_07270 [Chloroflexi bacterium]|nr:MAG: hypothetical protein D6706_07270 [Chloroflexota bacterium]